MLQAPHIVTELPGPKSRALVEQEAAHLAPGMQSLSGLSGIAVARNVGSVIEDVDGNRFLDLAAGICVNALGGSHPRYTQIMVDQLEHVTVGSFTTERRALALAKVAAHAPAGLDRVQLYSGGTEAVEAALRLAKSHTGKHEFLAFWGGFHGKTAGTMSLIGDGTKNGLGPKLPGTYHAPYADCYRCPLKLQYPSCGVACADFAGEVVKRETTGALAAIIMEPIQGTAGNIVPPPEFMQRMRALADEHDALLISDEMICGFGRSGKWFGCEHSGTRPDVMTIGKSLGAGFPVSGLVSSAEVTRAKPWGNPSGSSSSYGGNPMAGAAVYASLSIIEEENLVEHAAALGAHMLDRFRALQEKHAFIGDVRGAGLLIGVELVRDRQTKEPLKKELCVRMFQSALRKGLISMVYSPHLRVNPPLTMTFEQADTCIELLSEVFDEVSREGSWRA